jgi:predicted small integral membrane protein
MMRLIVSDDYRAYITIAWLQAVDRPTSDSIIIIIIIIIIIMLPIKP